MKKALFKTLSLVTMFLIASCSKENLPPSETTDSQNRQTQKLGQSACQPSWSTYNSNKNSFEANLNLISKGLLNFAQNGDVKDIISKGISYTGLSVDFDYVVRSGQDKNVSIEQDMIQSAIANGETQLNAGTIPIKIKPIIINGISFQPVIKMPYMFSQGKSATWDGKTPEYIVNILSKQGQKWNALTPTGQVVLLSEAEIVNKPCWIVTLNKFCDVLPHDLNVFDYPIPNGKIMTFKEVLEINDQFGTTKLAASNYVPSQGVSTKYKVYLYTNQLGIVSEVYLYNSLYDYLTDLENPGAFITCDKKYEEKTDQDGNKWSCCDESGNDCAVVTGGCGGVCIIRCCPTV